jgi:hypothetical protein
MRVVRCRPRLALKKEEITCVISDALPTSNYNFDTQRSMEQNRVNCREQLMWRGRGRAWVAWGRRWYVWRGRTAVAAREEAGSGSGGAHGGAGRRWCAWGRRGVGAALVAHGGAWGAAGARGARGGGGGCAWSMARSGRARGGGVYGGQGQIHYVGKVGHGPTSIFRLFIPTFCIYYKIKHIRYMIPN